MKQDLFTIILLHYNQQKYIYEALDSILMQKYQQIELIITDDASKLNADKIKKYVKKHNQGNIVNLDFVLNEENIGTVRTTNKALKMAQGEYILIFAADDALYNNMVISNFVSNFKKYPNDYIISAQTYMLDINLKKLLYKYVKPEYALKVNELNAKEQNNVLSNNCLYAAGSTAYRKEIFEKMNYLALDYTLVEDWSFWLRATRNGYTIRYVDFNGLKHRDGGISKSENTAKKTSKAVCKYYKDLGLILILEVIPYIKFWDIKKSITIFKNYNNIMYFLALYAPEMITPELKPKFLYLQHPVFWVYKMLIRLKALLKKIIRFIKMYFNYIIWFILNFIILLLPDNNLVLKLLIIFINYYLAIFIVKILIFVYRKLRSK